MSCYVSVCTTKERKKERYNNILGFKCCWSDALPLSFDRRVRCSIPNVIDVQEKRGDHCIRLGSVEKV